MNYTNEILKLSNQICFPLYASGKEITRRYKPYLDEIDITYTQYIVLMVLWENDHVSVKEIGERLYLDRVNAQCLSLLPWYQTIMEMGGFYQVSSLKKITSLLSKHTRTLLKGKKTKFNDAHIINMMRCETHRWVLSRIFELLNRCKVSYQ